MKVTKGAVKECCIALKQVFSSEEDVDLLIPGGQEKQQDNFCSFNTAAISCTLLSQYEIK